MTVSQIKAILSKVDDETVIAFFVNDQPASLHKIELRFYDIGTADKYNQFVGIGLDARKDPPSTRNSGTCYEK